MGAFLEGDEEDMNSVSVKTKEVNEGERWSFT